MDGLVFAVAAIGIPVGLGDLRAFDECAGGEGAGQAIEMLIRERMVFGKGDGDVADAAGLGGSEGGAGAFANLVGR